MLDAFKALLNSTLATMAQKRKSSTSKQQSGDTAEALAESFLLKHGLTLVTRNFCCRFGEIDLIMQHQQARVFVEVRYRNQAKNSSAAAFGGALESISTKKQQKIIRAAQFYLGTLAALPECRFDVVLLDKLDSANIEWIRGAFDASEASA
jgi:putative endonuclease